MDVKTVNWAAIRCERELGATFRALAEKHGLSVATLYRRARMEGWGERNSRAEDTAEVVSRLRLAMLETLEDENVTLTIRDMKDLAALTRELLALEDAAHKSDETGAPEVRLVLADEVERWSV